MMNAERKDDSPYGVRYLEPIERYRKNGDLFNQGDAGVRRQLLLDVRRLSLKLETPADPIMIMAEGEHQRVHGFDSCCRVKLALYPILRIAVALKLFESVQPTERGPEAVPTLRPQ